METFFRNLYFHLDAVLVFFYRFTGIPILDYLIGTFCLSLLAVIVGELTVSLALRYNKPYIDGLGREMNEKEKLSIAAYESGDREKYKALNKAATDAWGKRFFTMVAYSAGILWPVPFVLGWMQTRFENVAFPLAFPLSLLFGDTVGYLFSFFPIYILARIVFKYLRPRLPYFKGVQKMLDAAGDESSTSFRVRPPGDTRP